MNGSEQPPESQAQRGARGGDRRQKDRRRQDRRAPVPPWRHPWAFVAYGVVGALVVLLLFTRGDDGPSSAATPAEVGTRAALPEIDTTAVGANAPVADAYGSGGHAALLAEGEAATGRRVRAELFCEPIRQVALRTGSNVTVQASVAEQADGAGRVPGAECRWGSETSAPTVLLVVPPALAAQFASAPEVEQSFVRRRQVVAEVEWIGRSEALALRTAAVLREIGS